MTTESQIAANRENSLSSTGPRSEEGKQNSSRNALTFGLFTMRDFVRPAEHDEYARLCAGFQADLNPEGAVEQTFAAAIVGASWRLRRCSLVEAGMAENFDLDPMEDEIGERIQRSVDRARGQAFNILRHSTAELRRLQTERAIRKEIFRTSDESATPGLARCRDVIRSINSSIDSSSAQLGSSCKPMPTMAVVSEEPSEPPMVGTPRNAQCPCGSGAKYKRCCGRNAPAVLCHAA